MQQQLEAVSLPEVAAAMHWPTLKQAGRDWGFVQGVLALDKPISGAALEDAVGAAFDVGLLVGRVKLLQNIPGILSTNN